VDVGDLVVRLRTTRGMSQQELATRAGTGVRSIGDIERGRVRRPQHSTLTALAGALGLSSAERDELFRVGRSASPRRRDTGSSPTSSRLLGRDLDVDQIARRLTVGGARLVTVIGPAGVGKTRLAGAVVSRLGGAAAPVAAATLAEGVGAEADIVLVDDVDADAAAVLSAVLTGRPRLRLVLTARTAARLRGEHLWPLRGLVTEAAVALFADRAGAARPGFAGTAANAAAIEAICAGLRGNPLGIGISAALLRGRECDELHRLLAPVLSSAGDPLDALVRWRISRLTRVERQALAVLSRYRTGVAAGDLPTVPGRDGDGTLAVLAGAALLEVADRGGRSWLQVPGAVRDATAARSGERTA